MKIFGGVQQIGVGVEDAEEAWAWYRRHFGFDIPLIDDSGVAGDMLPYTGHQPHRRRAILALNLQGGGGLEIWQYADRKPQEPASEPRLGDLGIFAARLRTADLDAALTRLEGSAPTVRRDPGGGESAFVRDPYGNFFQLRRGPAAFARTAHPVGGLFGAVLGVSDLDASLSFFRDTLGYDRIAYRERGSFADLESLPGGRGSFARALIARSAPSAGPFARLLGPSEIELFQALDRTPRRIFEGRLWGDLGFIHLCFDVRGMADYKSDCAKAGHAFTADSNPGAESGGAGSFDMGEAAGRFAYIEDPDGSLIELVETHRIPILARLGWFLDLRRRDGAAALPDWMLKSLALGRAREKGGKRRRGGRPSGAARPPT